MIVPSRNIVPDRCNSDPKVELLCLDIPARAQIEMEMVKQFLVRKRP